MATVRSSVRSLNHPDKSHTRLYLRSMYLLREDKNMFDRKSSVSKWVKQTIVVDAWLRQTLENMFIERVTWNSFVAHGTGHITESKKKVLKTSMRLRRIIVGTLIVGVMFESDVTKEIQIKCSCSHRLEICRRGAMSTVTCWMRIENAMSMMMVVTATTGSMPMMTGWLLIEMSGSVRMGTRVSKIVGGTRRSCSVSCRRWWGGRRGRRCETTTHGYAKLSHSSLFTRRMVPYFAETSKCTSSNGVHRQKNSFHSIHDWSSLSSRVEGRECFCK